MAALGLPCYSQNLVIVAHGLSYPKTCGIFPDQGLNLCSLNWQVDSKPLDHQRSPLIFISVLFSCSVMSHSLQLQHARLPGACSNSCPSSQWCHPTTSSSVVPFSCFQYFSASGSFAMSQFFTSGGKNIGASASASVLPMNIQDWSPLGSTSLISLQAKELSRVSPTPQFKNINFSVLSFLYGPTLTSVHDY